MSSNASLHQRYTGRSGYYPDYENGLDTLLVAVPCPLEGRAFVPLALLDTASHWSMLPEGVARSLGFDPEVTGSAAIPVSVRTGRRGVIRGRLERIWIRLPAEDGTSLDLDVLCFVSTDWTDPLVLGWKGCLETIRVELDPSTDSFYFGSL